jgi:hypothetical protein
MVHFALSALAEPKVRAHILETNAVFEKRLRIELAADRRRCRSAEINCTHTGIYEIRWPRPPRGPNEDENWRFGWVDFRKMDRF